jgi:GDP-L-fucose synthase
VSWWNGKKILVAGGGGFIGSHLVEELLRTAPRAKVAVAGSIGPTTRRNLAAVIKKVRLVKADLRDLGAARRAVRGQDVVLNLAAKVGGVAYNSVHHGSLFRDNMLLGLVPLEAARLEKVGRYLAVSSACVYPRDCAIPTPESEGFRGRPEATNEGYGWSKRMTEYAAAAYSVEFGMKVAIARPYNAYGPRDDFDPASSHVIAGLVRRVCEGENPLTVWGDGKSTRSFLYVEDFARGLLEVAEKWPKAEALNLGGGGEISIRELAETIVRLAGAGVKIKFDASKPSGQPRRACDGTRAAKAIGFAPRVSLGEGLTRTIAWYREHLMKRGRR